METTRWKYMKFIYYINKCYTHYKQWLQKSERETERDRERERQGETERERERWGRERDGKRERERERATGSPLVAADW